MKKKVHLCKAEVNALTKRVENYDNLQKIASSALEVANKENGELNAKGEELTADATDLKQQLSGTGATAVNEYVAHFHETGKG